MLIPKLGVCRDLSAAIAASSNKALHWTAIPLRSIAASEPGRYTSKSDSTGKL